MLTANQSVVADAQHYVRNLFAAKSFKNLVYHNLDHTLEVVHYCEELAAAHGLDSIAKETLLVAAWFHDTGYLKVAPRDHEEESKRIAREFLIGRNATDEFIHDVENCIEATKMPQAPTNLLEQILCDADLYHLGTDNFNERSMLLRDEVNNLNKNNHVSKKDWRQLNIDFLERHRYFTDHARDRLEPQKERNIAMLKEKIGKKEKKIEQDIEEKQPALEAVAALSPAAAELDADVRAAEEPTGNGQDVSTKGQEIADSDGQPGLEKTNGLQVTEDEKDKAGKEKKKKKKDEQIDPAVEKQKRTERGVVAMFRIMSENHINLSQMADTKANIMISINTIVISILVSVLLGKLQFYPQYIIPTIILISVCLGAIVFAILATRPNVSGGKFSREDIENKEINLLFFGNFYNMELQDYDWAMKEMMQDKDYLYGSMIKDMYFLGVVLARKYKLLRISFNIFMFGLVAAIIAFSIALLTTTQ